jgi:hypothetical protein
MIFILGNLGTVKNIFYSCIHLVVNLGGEMGSEFMREGKLLHFWQSEGIHSGYQTV